MSKESKSIVNFDFQLIIDFFKLVKRQGPGSEEVTLKALNFIEDLPDAPRIADLGCGSGGQTITLAEHTNGDISALDLSADFIDILNNNVKSMGYEDRFTVLQRSMDNLPFSAEEFDLIWSEGAIYNIGFERGLNEWRKYIKKGGYIAVSEVSWFTKDRPKEIEEFWMNNYPEIDSIWNKVKQMTDAGYSPVAQFVLPEYCWLDFYAPMEEASKRFLEQYNYSEAAKQFIEFNSHEISIYKKYKEYYGYVFYIGKKI